jgi:hypothetical protein
MVKSILFGKVNGIQMNRLNKREIPSCFGNQAEPLLHGEPVVECIDCDVFDKCHKITVAGCLQALSTDLNLIVSNGLSDGTLKDFKELEEVDGLKDLTIN